MERDALQSIKNSERDDMLFLEWILDNYPSRKRTSIH
jgi:hypothetical protein